MEWFVKTFRQVGTGAATGAGIALAVSLFGFGGGQGWQRKQAGFAMAIALIFALVVLGSIVIKQGYGPMFGFKSTEEEEGRRRSLLPFIAGVTLALLLAYLLVQPPPITQ